LGSTTSWVSRADPAWYWKDVLRVAVVCARLAPAHNTATPTPNTAPAIRLMCRSRSASLSANVSRADDDELDLIAFTKVATDATLLPSSAVRASRCEPKEHKRDEHSASHDSSSAFYRELVSLIVRRRMKSIQKRLPRIVCAGSRKRPRNISFRKSIRQLLHPLVELEGRTPRNRCSRRRIAVIGPFIIPPKFFLGEVYVRYVLPSRDVPSLIEINMLAPPTN